MKVHDTMSDHVSVAVLRWFDKLVASDAITTCALLEVDAVSTVGVLTFALTSEPLALAAPHQRLLDSACHQIPAAERHDTFLLGIDKHALTVGRSAAVGARTQREIVGSLFLHRLNIPPIEAIVRWARRAFPVCREDLVVTIQPHAARQLAAHNNVLAGFWLDGEWVVEIVDYVEKFKGIRIVEQEREVWLDRCMLWRIIIVVG
jgi:hypothetical protein